MKVWIAQNLLQTRKDTALARSLCPPRPLPVAAIINRKDSRGGRSSGRRGGVLTNNYCHRNVS